VIIINDNACFRLSLLSELNISQVSVAMNLRCSGIFDNDYSKFTNEYISERISKIRKHLAKLWTKV